jgi:hypothetical protein
MLMELWRVREADEHHHDETAKASSEEHDVRHAESIAP